MFVYVLSGTVLLNIWPQIRCVKITGRENEELPKFMFSPNFTPIFKSLTLKASNSDSSSQ